ncbi:hypothetical protein JZK55_18650 [Dissulfurispira thermophila]|uniref:Solute-binding protein family 3/N-terminal domain-containing protein n=2 Tax=root TaxID=1 RepID=A0A7G1H498_9BACT|nr:phosphate/phosphite/phosphonate ABC transporter substrate-binding protein [Dissulfurispira thermophila]BCB96943.1 hypothetical protein JZK55_18650 [Dissulfurispira thermophila]
MFYKFVKCSVFLFVLFFLLPETYARDKNILIFGIHPYLPASELIDRFTPLSNYLSRKTGKKIVIEVSKDYNDHIEKIGNDKIDIAFMGPVSYVKMVQKYGKKSLICRLEVNGRPTFRGVIVVSKDSKIKVLSDLKGKRFAFVDPESTMGYIVPLYLFLIDGINIRDFSSYRFLYNHHNVVLGVLAGDFDAGAVKEDIFYEYEKRGLRALAWSPDISEHVIVTNKKVSKKTIRELSKAIFQLKNSREGIKILKKIQPNLTGMVSADDKDYENLRNIYQRLIEVGYKL